MTDRLEFKASDAEYVLRLRSEQRLLWPVTSPTQVGDVEVPMISIALAQKLFDEWLARQPEIFCMTEGEHFAAHEVWARRHPQRSTHRARLVCIEKLEGKQ